MKLFVVTCFGACVWAPHPPPPPDPTHVLSLRFVGHVTITRPERSDEKDRGPWWSLLLIRSSCNTSTIPIVVSTGFGRRLFFFFFPQVLIEVGVGET